ncbi:hypothetical protein BJ742DRAFT_833048 [Cladochytrium replicatum]|nr:hypothetical protein BJ742DRAFT_833048 [Cladochytrium replicatum]
MHYSRQSRVNLCLRAAEDEGQDGLESDVSEDEWLENLEMEMKNDGISSMRQTARQKRIMGGDDGFDDMFNNYDMPLPDERVSKKKKLTAEEESLRRSETARKRKHQSEQRAEEEKRATIQKLLKKQAPRRRTKENEPEANQPAVEVKPTRIRYIQRGDASSLSFPEGIEISLTGARAANYPPPRATCAVQSCCQPFIYTVPHSGLKACSLAHFRLL